MSRQLEIKYDEISIGGDNGRIQAIVELNQGSNGIFKIAESNHGLGGYQTVIGFYPFFSVFVICSVRTSVVVKHVYSLSIGAAECSLPPTYGTVAFAGYRNIRLGRVLVNFVRC